MTKPLHILYVGPIDQDGTCRHRLEALQRLGQEVECITTTNPFRNVGSKFLRRVFVKLSRHVDLRGANKKILQRLSQGQWDVLWVDNGFIIHPATLQQAKVRQRGLVRVSYSPDDMLNPKTHTRRYLAAIPYYDLHVTTKSYNVSELEKLGAPRAFFVGNAYQPEVHRPVEVTEADRERLGVAPVGFIGECYDKRAEIMNALARDGIPIAFRCPSWPRHRPRPTDLRIIEGYLAGDDYARFLCGCKIVLCFLHKGNRDLQTTRSVEIPACGVFMLAERTDEHLALFREGVEAEFFGDYEELLRKTRYYLEHEEERQRIAGEGRRRCLESGYSNVDRLQAVLQQIAQVRAGQSLTSR